MIAEAAWVSSYDKSKREKRSDDDVGRVVKMLAASGHSTPFESVTFRFWVRLPIHADRQLMTHRMQSSNGLSGRYRTLPEDWLPLADDVHKIFDKVGSGLGAEVSKTFDTLMNQQQVFYKEMLAELKGAEKAALISNAEYKRAREVMRGVIGTASMTERVTTMNLRSFANFIRLRLSEHAQREIFEVAKLMLAEVRKANICPAALWALGEAGWRI